MFKAVGDNLRKVVNQGSIWREDFLKIGIN